MTADDTQVEFELTDDAVFNGRLSLRQPRRGYRFSVDAPLLIWFAARRGRADLAADLGAGCGIVGLGLLAAGVADEVVGLEVQPGLARLALANARRNGLEGRYRLLAGDMRLTAGEERRVRGACDLVVANPPFWPAGQGRPPRCQMRGVACHEVSIDLDGWVGTAARLLRPPRGRLCAVFPARRLGSLLARLEAHGLVGETLLPVFPRAREPAELVLISARPGSRERLVIEAPLFMRDEQGNDSPELSAILDGSFSGPLSARPDTRAFS